MKKVKFKGKGVDGEDIEIELEDKDWAFLQTLKDLTREIRRGN